LPSFIRRGDLQKRKRNWEGLRGAGHLAGRESKRGGKRGGQLPSFPVLKLGRRHFKFPKKKDLRKKAKFLEKRAVRYLTGREGGDPPE